MKNGEKFISIRLSIFVLIVGGVSSWSGAVVVLTESEEVSMVGDCEVWLELATRNRRRP